MKKALDLIVNLVQFLLALPLVVLLVIAYTIAGILSAWDD